MIEAEELRELTLLAHSYGGMVGTAVADRARDRVVRLIYVDAFVPRDGQRLFDLLPEGQAEMMKAQAAAGDGWRVPPIHAPPDTSPADLAWLDRRRVGMPIGCFRQPLRLAAEPACRRDYVYALRKPPTDTFGPFAARARREPGWTCRDIDASHSPNVTAPELLMETVEAILRG